MKKQLKPLLLVALFTTCSATLFAQTPSTEGKEFWVALNMTTGTGGDKHEPFICITTQYQGGSYTITNPADASFTPITGPIPPTGYIKIYASTNPRANEIDLNKWYPVGQTAQKMSCQSRNVGLKVTTTVESSVFVGNRLPQSFDAANILPITALQTDYITQDYPGYDHENKGGGYPVITILATENNTQVTINPSSNVLNSNGTTTITKTLDAGQVFYITGDNRATLSGTAINSDKKIAVFTGVNNTDVPGPVSARDHLYEQNMPVDYWGTHFVVTRSMKKDANRIRVTASNNNTDISIDGDYITTINSGETYEFELCSKEMREQESYTKANEENRGTTRYFTDYAHYLETSCPCAVFSYDVSENYYIKKNGTSERDENSHGDPSMVWISPLEQQLTKVTFGVMNTNETPTHYVNIITPTSGAESLEVKEITMNDDQVVYGNNLVQASDVQPVPGNKAYSYARIKLVENAESVYTITSNVGFIAHVYGSGDKESYAYSCGSSTVHRGLMLDNTSIEEGSICQKPFCYSVDLQMKLNIGNNDYESIEWDFGDGTTYSPPFSATNEEKEKAEHKYSTPGWYDLIVTAVYTNACTGKPFNETMTFSFSITKPDTVRQMVERGCIAVDSTLNGIKLTPAEVADYLTRGKNDTVKGPNCYDTVYINLRQYGIETMEPGFSYEHRDMLEYQLMGADSVYVPEIGKYFSNSADTVIISENEYLCNHFHPYYVHVITCVNMEAEHDEVKIHACKNDSLLLEYTQRRGDISDVRLLLDKITVHQIDGEEPVETYTNVKDTTFTWEAWKDWEYINEDSKGVGHISLPTNDLDPGRYRLTMALVETNEDCKRNARDTFFVERNFTINYPRAIVIQKKLNNVLAVLSSTYNGGYEFIGFQWYKNGEPIEGATGAIYHSDIPFDPNDVYTVALTDTNGVTVNSCDIEPEALPEEPVEEPTVDEGTENAAPAQKLLYRNHMIIRKEGQLFNIYGQKIQ